MARSATFIEYNPDLCFGEGCEERDLSCLYHEAQKNGNGGGD